MWCSSAKRENFKFFSLFHASIMPHKYEHSTHRYNWDHKGWSELPEGEKEWRLSINHSNPQQGNVYKGGQAFYYSIRRLSSGYEPSREGEARWMYESDKGWEVYDQAHSDEIEDAWQNKKKSVTIITESRTVHVDLKHLQQFQDGADNTKAERVRRQQLSKGISRMWQVRGVRARSAKI